MKPGGVDKQSETSCQLTKQREREREREREMRVKEKNCSSRETRHTDQFMVKHHQSLDGEGGGGGEVWLRGYGTGVYRLPHSPDQNG